MAEEKKSAPFVPAETKMAEFTFRAVLLGVLMAVMMGAANAYLGLKAGMTIAATYTTAVIGMAVLKAMKGTLLEENAARTVGSIGGNVATGAIFTLPAFFIASIWNPFFSLEHYVLSTIMLVFAGILGIMYVTILRRVLVEDTELPFPESIAAAEIHKSGQSGVQNSRFLFMGMGVGALFSALVEFKFIAAGWQKNRLALQGRDDAAGAGDEPGVLRRRLYHRPEARGHQLQRRRAGVGPSDADDRLLHPPRRSRGGDELDGRADSRVEELRPLHRHRRDARRRLLHPVQDAEQPLHGNRPLVLLHEEVRGG